MVLTSWGLQACLSLAFVVEGTLFAFHLEGALLNVHAHLLLVLCIFAAAGTLLLEMQFPGNVLLGIARAQLVMLQGVWFTQIARLLFEGAALCWAFCYCCALPSPPQRLCLLTEVQALL